MSARFLLAMVVAALVGLAAPAGAWAQVPDFIVTSELDTPPDGCEPGPGGCTLREAVTAADDFESIELPPGHYMLTLGEALVLDVDLQIFGAGARTTIIDATGQSRVGYVGGLTSANVVISGVTVTGGDANAADDPDAGEGGAFRVAENGELWLQQSAVVGNVAGSNGGGISSLGELEIDHSLVADNHVTGAGDPRGGGIYVGFGADDLRVDNSTISGNTVDGAEARGGGIYVESEFDLEHVTIAANRAADGGGLYQGAGVNLEVTMTNTLLAGNIGGACGDAPELIDTDHNLADDATCVLNGTGDLPPGDARLAPLDNYGGATNTHALYTGSPAIDGSNNCGDVDQRGVTRPGTPCDIGAFEGSIAPPAPGPPPPSPPPPPQPSPQLPPPVAGESVNALPKSGTVKIKLPRSSAFVTLSQGQQIPVGTIVDTKRGRVTLVAAADKTGGTSTADFYDGIFRLGQTKGSKPITTLKLVEKLSCPKRGQASAAAKKKKRRLWGDGKGRFRTEGSYSSATVRGTRWLTEDRCDSTLVRVVVGSVTVRDFVKKKTVIVKAGKKYVAKRKR